MSNIVFTSRIRSDGVLHLDVPVGVRFAGQEVQVTVEPVAKAVTPEEWRQRVLETAGQWQGELERPEQGEYEERESLS